ncbi:hypothetical protein HY251_13670 [bacterium]|nr:hypothetical protein [bacterium]
MPRLLTKDAMVASRSLLVERPFTPVELVPSGLGFRPSPPLLGFVMTEAKDGAEVLLGSAKDLEGPDDGPILARWRFGLGKSAAFTSDAAARWSQEWLAWPGYDVLFGNLARWVERDPRPAGLAIALDLEAGEGVVTVEADERSPAALELRVSVPSGAIPVSPLPLDPIAPGRYRARFPATRPGAYFVGVEEVQPSGARVPRGTAAATLAYPREFKDLASNPALLEKIARVSGGRALSLEDRGSQLWRHERPPTRAPRSLLPWLVALAGALLALEIAVMRLALPEDLRAKLRELGRRREASPGQDAVIEKLLARKAAEATRVPLAHAPVPASAPPPSPSPLPELPKAAPPAAPASAAPEVPSSEDDSFTAQLLKAKKRARGDEERK